MKKVLRHFWPSIKEHWMCMTLVSISMIAIVLLEAVHPYLLRQFVDVFTEEGGTATQAYYIFSLLFGLLMVVIVIHRIFDWSILFFEARVIKKLMVRSYVSITNQSLRFFENNFTGSLVKKAGRFHAAFEQIADSVFFQLGRVAVIIVLTMYIFANEYPQLTWLYGGWVVLFIGVNAILAFWKYPLDKAEAESDSRLGAQFADSLGNYAAVKSFAKEASEIQRFSEIADDNYKKRKRAWGANNWINLAQGSIMTIFELTLVYVMISGWEKGVVTIGDFVFFQSYVLWMFSNLWGISNSIRRVYQSLANAEEMVEIFEMTPEVQDAPGAQLLRVKGGEICLHNVCFSYQSSGSAKRQEISDVNLTIKKGESIAIVGPSGAGKTTIVKLLMRYFDLDSGYITIDDQDITTVTQASLRHQIALVPQEPALFHRTLEQNIAFANPNASKEDVIRAASQAHAWGFIQELPDGLNTLVGERGVKLSGGERQRIALARAFLADNPILILDEATSSLDSKTEKEIQAAIVDLLEGRTSIVIAHRLSTIMQMDRIIVMEGGKIVEQGTHDALLAQGGMYSTLWSHQSGGYIGE